MPHINEAGLELIETFEGDELRSYPDPGSGGDPWTIGYGHTAGVHPGQTITQAEAIAFLKQDVTSAEQQVVNAVHVVLTPNQFSALVSFQYNTGAPAHSTIYTLVNQKKFADAADEFGKWIWASGVKLPGLVRRRAAEKALFLKK